MLLLSSWLIACSSVMYYPRIQNQQLADPAIVKLQPEDVEISTESGLKVHAWWFHAKTKNSKGTLVFFHGNAENLTSHFLALSWMPDLGYNYLIWDYPGYGLSEGEPSPKANAQAAISVVKWVHENKDPGALIIFGQSMGGHIALRAAQDVRSAVPLKAVVLDGAFQSNRSIARKKMSEHWLTWILQPVAWLLMNDSYAPEDASAIAPTPLLVIVGGQDDVVSPQFGEQIFAQAQEPKQIWRIPEGRHIDTFWMHGKVYRQKFIEYLDSLR